MATKDEICAAFSAGTIDALDSITTSVPCYSDSETTVLENCVASTGEAPESYIDNCSR